MKHTWTNGEIITANKLNNIEDGIKEIYDGPFCHIKEIQGDGERHLSLTVQEILDAIDEGKLFANYYIQEDGIYNYGYSLCSLKVFYVSSSHYNVSFFNRYTYYYNANSLNDYPSKTTIPDPLQ